MGSDNTANTKLVLSEDDIDERANNIIAAGGVWAMFRASKEKFPNAVDVDVVTIDGVATNKLRVTLAYMKSPFIVTVTRDASGDE